MAGKVYVAVIGAGYWGRKLIREYIDLSKENDKIKLAAIVDSSRIQLQYVAEEMNIPLNILYTNPTIIAKNEEINAVHIATPNETHYELASNMLENGKHVLLEKPMALTSRQAFKLARISEEKDRILLVGHIFRFNNALKKMKEILSKNNEEIYYIDLSWTTHMKPPRNRDIIFDLAPHPIDIINFLTNEWPYEVYSIGNSYIRQKHGLEEAAYTLFKLPGSTMGSIKLSWIEHGPKTREVRIVTYKNTYIINALIQSITLYSIEEKKNITVTPSNTMKEMIKHFTELILNGGSPNNSALIGALTVVTLEAMRESILKNIPIQVLSK